MSNQSNDYGWIGWAVAAVIGIFFIFSIFNPNSEDSDTSSATKTLESSATIPLPTTEAAAESEPTQEDSNAWQCEDATSYNQNAYDDNICTNGDETKYVSDSEAVELDPNYSPGKSGAEYYNNQ